MPGVVDKGGSLRNSGSPSRNQSTSFDGDNQENLNMKGGSRNRYPNGYNSDHMSDGADDTPRYFLEHLATFSVGSDFGLVSPKDGLRRLLQMEKSNGIWTQKMQMKLDKNWVYILDYEDGDVVEKFPMNLISDPTAYTSEDPRELYNNILIFIVQEDVKNKNPNQSEMHIFQCSKVYAQDVVDEMKMFISGKTKLKGPEGVRHLPPPPHNPPPDPPINGNSSKVREHVAMFNATSSAPVPSLPHPPPPRGSSVLQQRIERVSGYARESNDETSSTTSDKYEREVTILNHCFDDIERFVVRLQHAAAAYKELERRQKSRKHKKKDMGDGMLSIRAKPPPEREFVDVLQKFKLSFNLLAKLKSHIHDPNAPELVHFLFTPLALIVDAARDSNHSANLAASVVSPLLTRDAIDLLANCCTSKETDLWHSLGDSWIIPRDQWKGYESSYRPIFSNGWAPENPLDESASSHRIQRPEMDPREREQDYQQRAFNNPERSRFRNEYFGSERGDEGERNDTPEHIRPYEHMPSEIRREFAERNNAMSPEANFHDPRERDMRSEFSSDSIEHHGDMPLSPERQFDRLQMQWLEDLKNQRAKIVQVVYPRTANNDKELTVVRGEILEIIDDSRKWWKARNMRGQIAHVPHTIVTPYPSADDDVFNNPVYGSRNSRENYYTTETSPSKDGFPDEGTTRSQEASGPSRQTQSDWVRRERQGHARPIPIRPSSERSETKNEDNFFPSPPPEYANHSRSPPIAEFPAYNWLPPPPDFDASPDHPSPEKYHADGNPRNWNDRKIRSHTPPSVTSPHRFSPPSQQPHNLSTNKEKKKKPTQTDADTNMELFQEELKNSLAQKRGQKVWKKITCPEHSKTDCYYINLSSTAEEVQHWLRLKGFSERAIDILKTMTPEMLFNLTRAQLEKHLGEEGTKLHSFLIIQKNMSGYKTYTSKELSDILADRKQKAEDV